MSSELASTSGSKPAVSERFCSPEADITLRSSDGILFRFYKKHLEVHAMAFAGAEGFTSFTEDVVDLTETSDVLDILLQFMLHQRPPTLTSLDFTVLNSFAEAVEKYEVFSAMATTEICMKAAIPDHPLEVLEYAARHKKVEIMDVAAVSSVGFSLDEAQICLSPETFMTWTRYCQRWWDALNYAHKQADSQWNGNPCHCNVWLNTLLQISRHLGARAESLKDLKKIDVVRTTKPGHKCLPDVERSLRTWKKLVGRKVSRIPKFSTLMTL